MESYEFIDPNEIGEHREKLSDSPAIWEVARLIKQDDRLTLEEKQKAWERLISTTPDGAFDTHGVFDEANIESVHGFLCEYMKIEKRLLKQFFQKEANAVYTYCFWCEEEQKWIGADGALYADFDGALAEFQDDADLEPDFALFTKRYIGAENKRLYLRMRPDGAVLGVEEALNDFDDEEYKIFYDVFYGMDLTYGNRLEKEK